MLDFAGKGVVGENDKKGRSGRGKGNWERGMERRKFLIYLLMMHGVASVLPQYAIMANKSERAVQISQFFSCVSYCLIVHIYQS